MQTLKKTMLRTEDEKKNLVKRLEQLEKKQAEQDTAIKALKNAK